MTLGFYFVLFQANNYEGVSSEVRQPWSSICRIPASRTGGDSFPLLSLKEQAPLHLRVLTCEWDNNTDLHSRVRMLGEKRSSQLAEPVILMTGCLLSFPGCLCLTPPDPFVRRGPGAGVFPGPPGKPKGQSGLRTAALREYFPTL